MLDLSDETSRFLSRVTQHQSISAVLIGGSMAVGFADKYSDLEISFYTHRFPSLTQRKTLYKSWGSTKFLKSNHHPGFTQYGFSDKIKVNGNFLDVIWIRINDLEEVLKTMGQQQKYFEADLQLIANLTRGHWIKTFQRCFVKKSDQRKMSRKLAKNILEDRRGLVEYENLEKLKSRKAWHQLAAELYLAFDGWATWYCLSKGHFPVGRKWLLRELELVSTHYAQFWNQAFLDMQNLDLESVRSMLL